MTRRPIKVRIVELDKEFSSLTEAAEYINGSVTPISRCLSGKQERYMWYTFEKVETDG